MFDLHFADFKPSTGVLYILCHLYILARFPIKICSRILMAAHHSLYLYDIMSHEK